MPHANQQTRACNLCGSPAPASLQPKEAVDICPGCSLRTRHRAYGALCSLIGDPTRNRKSLLCHATPKELALLFPDARDRINFDIRPANFLDLVMDVQNMSKIPDSSQDVFVGVHVLQQVRDDRRALAEIARVLRPDGAAIFTVPFRRGAATQPYPDVTDPFGPEALEKYGVGTFRRYGLDDFSALLELFFAVSMYTFADPITGYDTSIFLARKLAS